MSVAHIMAAGMGGIRTAGDLVAWMQLTQRMKITEAKEYVARKLGINVTELADEEVMHQVRQDLDIATLPMIADGASGIVAKCRIAELLDIELNSVNRFKSKLDLSKFSPR
jgi:dimethylamine--corrinoid protein Co-methyltransferase